MFNSCIISTGQLLTSSIGLLQNLFILPYLQLCHRSRGLIRNIHSICFLLLREPQPTIIPQLCYHIDFEYSYHLHPILCHPLLCHPIRCHHSFITLFHRFLLLHHPNLYLYLRYLTEKLNIDVSKEVWLD